MVITLGIESTAHTFGASIVKNGKILSNVKDMFTTIEGGLIPMEVKKHHEKLAPQVYAQALKKANIKENQIDVIAFSQGPGLPPCLIAGRNFARDLALKLKCSIIGVNHCIAHLEIGQSVGAKDPVLLYTSGANTQIIAYSGGKYRILGETMDIGVGNFIDNFARVLNLGFPGGPKIEKLAKKGKNFIDLPYNVKGMDVAFSGLLTNLKTKYQKGENTNDLCFSMQETVFAQLLEVAERALSHTGKTELVLGGGVACNKKLRQMAKQMCKERNCKLFCPKAPLLVDNAAMIGYLGEIMHKKGLSTNNQEQIKKIDINPRERTDDVEVKW